MTCQPADPGPRHVWVRPPGDHGETVAGVVISWQHAPVHNANAADWVALVATAPFGTALHVQWVGAERLVALRDAAPTE